MKKYKTKKKSYLPSQVVNTISDEFNDAVFLSEKRDLASAKKKMLDAFERALPEFEKYSYPKPIKLLKEDLLLAIKADGDNAITEINDALDSRRNKADVLFSKGKYQLLDFFQRVSQGKSEDAVPPPWLTVKSSAEKFMPFYEKSERALYKGFKNQMILLLSSEFENEDMITLNRSDLVNLIEKTLPKGLPEKDKKVAVNASLKGVSSFASIYVPMSKEIYLDKNKRIWRCEESGRTRPTPQEILSQDLKKLSRVSFKPSPVWSVSSVQNLLDCKSLDMLEKLRNIRLKESNNIEIKVDNKDKFTYVESEIKKLFKEQCLPVSYGENKAFFSLVKDSIRMPIKTQFTNPVAYYSVSVHELAHSTLHLNQRDISLKGNNKGYAFEELVAESTAFLMVASLKEKIKKENNGVLPKEWGNYFEEARKRSVNYNIHYGKEIDFSAAFSQLAKGEDGLVDKLVNEVAKATRVLHTGQVNGVRISENLRRKSLEENFKASGLESKIPKKNTKEKEKEVSLSF